MSSDFKPGKYDEKVETFCEHLLPPILTYFVRKVNLAVVLGLLYVAKILSRPYGFDCEASVSDREVWKWKPYEKIPVYHAHLEKVE